MYVIYVPGKGFVDSRWQAIIHSDYFSKHQRDAYVFKRLSVAYSIAQQYLWPEHAKKAEYYQLATMSVTSSKLKDCAEKFWNSKVGQVKNYRAKY